MRSVTIRICNKFDLSPEDNTLPITHKGQQAGTISNADDTRIISNTVFHIFYCTYFRVINDRIILDDGTIHEHYKKADTFRLYYSKKSNVFFVPGATGTIKTFLKDLSTEYPDRFNFENYHFEFNQIRTANILVKGVWFKVDDDLVDSKAFFGEEVDRDAEANDALDAENGTYLISQMDVAGVERTIGFSQKSVIVIYNTIQPTDEIPLPYLQTVFDAFNSVKNL
ncbi:hypothetical protein [Limosilactobacillus fermentum]|uniref:hypothetical protein n=1 Tax=Limosilactobacillus fermentum TaxID=1613 RepID=UPI002243622E|nr:hypothetical protein [Limosilactobacillus fermentum]UZM84701.1 hypothetical protein OP867_07390 [Limosilactobacillus fermentum]